MTDKKDNKGIILPDKDRLTKIGVLFRKTSLDELPQLYNVFIGDMSLVGPRPLLVSYLSLYSNEQALRHTVRPGITGWAQVNGRNAIDWETKLNFDVWYAKNLSLFIDIKILVMTAWKVLKRDNISSSTSATMEPFKGSTNIKKTLNN